MKKIILFILLFGLAITGLGAVTQIDETFRQFLVNKNILDNPGMEYGKSKWTASGGSLTTETGASDVGSGLTALSWDSSSASQTLDTNLKAIVPGLYGHNGVASCNIRCASGTCTHLLQVHDGTNLVQSGSIVSNTSYATSTIFFQFPSSGSLKLRLKSVASNEPKIYIDDCKVIDEQGYTAQINQAQYLGDIKWVETTNCSWTGNDTNYLSFAADTDCPAPTVTGILQAPGTKIPGFVLPNMGPGNYYIVANGYFRCGDAGVDCKFRFYDGTNGSEDNTVDSQGVSGVQTIVPVVTGHFLYTQAQGSTTIRLQQKSKTATTVYVQASTDSGDLTMSVYYFPSQSQTILKADQIANSWSGIHENDCSFGYAGSAFGEFAADTSCTFTPTSNVNFGTVTSYNDGTVNHNLPGIVFTPSRISRYFICAYIDSSNSSGVTDNYFKLTDGTATIGRAATYGVGGGPNGPVTLCGIYQATSVASTTIKILGGSGAGTLSIAPLGASSGNAVTWNIFQIDQQFPTPVLVNSVVTNLSGVTVLHSASIDSSGTVTEKTGDWINGNCSKSSSVYTCTLNAIWSSAPSCTVSPVAGAAAFSDLDTVSTTQVIVRTFNILVAATDEAFQIICVGPK